MHGPFPDDDHRVRVIAVGLVLAATFLAGTLSAESLPELSPPPASSRFT